MCKSSDDDSSHNWEIWSIFLCGKGTEILKKKQGKSQAYNVINFGRLELDFYSGSHVAS